MVPSDQLKLFSYVDSHLSFYQEQWQEILGRLALSDWPLHQAALTHLLTSSGLTVHSPFKDTSLLYADSLGASRSLLLYNHYNRLSPSPKELLAILTRLAALDAYQKTLGPLPVAIKWLIDTSDQAASTLDSTLKTYASEFAADGCLLDVTGLIDVEFPFLALGTKGYLNVALEVHTGESILPSSYGSVAPDAAWRLLWALASLKDAHEAVLIEGFYDTLLPADDETLALLSVLPDSSKTLAQHWGLSGWLFDLRGFQFHYTHLLTPTCTINAMTSLASPDSRAHIPARAQALLDFFLVPNQEPDDIFARLQHHLGEQGFSDVQLRLLNSFSPFMTPPSNPFVALVRTAMQQSFGQSLPLLPFASLTHALTAFHDTLALPTLLLAFGDLATEYARPAEAAASLKFLGVLLEEMRLAL